MSQLTSTDKALCAVYAVLGLAALVGTLLTPALHYLGAFPDPQTGRAALDLARNRRLADGQLGK